jgi:protein-disulfide isomerase
VPKRGRSMPRALAGPRAAQVAKRSRRAKSNALWLRAALAGTLLIVGVLGTVLAAGASSNQESRIDGEVKALLAGIPQEKQALGARSAPVTLQVFADLEDNDSKRWFLTFLPAIIRELVRTGRLRIEYRSFKTNTIGSETFVKQQAAALAAGAQNKLWNYVDTFYHEQGEEYTPYVTESYLDDIARQAPTLNIGQWSKGRSHDSRIEQVVEEDQQGRAEGIHVTPMYRIGRTGGALRTFTGSEYILYAHQVHPTTFTSAEDLAKAIDQIH